MRHILLVCVFPLLFLPFVKGQVTYDPGYIVLENGQRLEGLIQNKGRILNPTSIRYKPSEQANHQELSIEEVQEFGIGMQFRFVKASVKIDRSTHKQHLLGNNPNPEWKEETLFLQLLVDGKASLYYYRDRKNMALFVQKDTSAINQLIYKPYRDAEAKLRYNTYYRNQLAFLLDCEKAEGKSLDKLLYSKSEMIRYFKAYHECVGAEMEDYTQKPKRDAFNLYVLGGVRVAQFRTVPFYFRPGNLVRLDFGRDSGFSFGMDLEYVLPFNRNKWSLFISPVYQHFTGEAAFDGDELSADYRSIEIPLGLRRYFYVNPNHKVFGALAYQLNADAGSEGVDFPSFNQEGLSLASKGNNWMVGFGYRYKRRLSIEGRIQSARNVKLGFWNWNIRYRTRGEIMIGIGIF